MKSSFSFSYLLVIALSALCASACSNTSDTQVNSDELSQNESEAEWVRVDVNLESAHPYQNNQDEEWELQAPEQAQGIRVHFNDFETEENQDYFVIGDHVYHGSLGSFTTDVAPGNLVPVQFSTDATINHYGYDIDYYEYLMPHSALRMHSTADKAIALREKANTLKIGLVRPTHSHRQENNAQEHSSFEEAHYDKLVEHSLIYRCWKTIPFLNIPAPFTLRLNPTSLFTANMIRQTQLVFDRPRKTTGLFNGKAISMSIDLKNINIGTKMATKIMAKTPAQSKIDAVAVNTETIQIGFGAWNLTGFNQTSHHAKASPKLGQMKAPAFKFKTQNKKPKIFFSFKLKNFKI